MSDIPNISQININGEAYDIAASTANKLSHTTKFVTYLNHGYSSTTNPNYGGIYDLSEQQINVPVFGTLPIEYGGTGATTSTNILSNFGALPLTGGTLTGNLIINSEDTLSNGNLVIKDSYADTENNTPLGPSQDGSSDSSLYFRDKNDKPMGKISVTNYPQDRKSEITINATRYTQIDGYHYINNYIKLTVDNNGTKTVEVSDGSIWRKAFGLGDVHGNLPITIDQGGTSATSALLARKNLFNSNLNNTAKHLMAITSGYAEGGYLSLPLPIKYGGTGTTTTTDALTNLGGFPLTGGTITGNISITKSNSSRFIAKNTTYTSTDTANSEVGLFGFHDKNGNWTGYLQNKIQSNFNQITLSVQRGSTNNYFQLNTSGDMVKLSHPSEWKKALGLNDDGWQTISCNGTNASGTIYYRKIGDIITMQAYSITLNKNLSSNLTIASYDSSLISKTHVFTCAMRNDGSNNIFKIGILTSGSIVAYANGTSISTGTTFNFSASWMLA